MKIKYIKYIPILFVVFPSDEMDVACTRNFHHLNGYGREYLFTRA